MTDATPYVPLKRIVSYVLDELSKSMSDFDKCWILAFRGLVDLNFDVSGEPKSVRIPLDANKTAPLPTDCLMWSKIGILNNRGEISSLRINNSLSIYRDNNPNRISQLTPDINDALPLLTGNPFYLNYYYNGMYQTLFGVGGGLIQYGDCRVDEKNRVILFPDTFAYEHVIVEYISSPEKDDDYQIELCMQEAVIAFIKWKLKAGTDRDYYAEAIKGRRRMTNKKVTLQSINQVIREATGFYLKS